MAMMFTTQLERTREEEEWLFMLNRNLHVNFYLVSRWLLMPCLNVAP